jgi:hypothetical protein
MATIDGLAEHGDWGEQSGDERLDHHARQRPRAPPQPRRIGPVAKTTK